MAIGWPTCPPRSARVVWNPVPKNGYEKGTIKEIAYVYRCTTVTYQIDHDSCRESRHRYSAGKAAKALKKRTLTNLYNAWPQWLADAHARLDAAVAAAYGWPTDITDEAALTELLARNRC